MTEDLFMKMPDEEAFAAFIESGSSPAWSERAILTAEYPYNVAPVHDNAPFFFFTFRTRRLIDQLFHPGQQGIDWKVNLGVAVLFMLLAISLAAVLAFLILPLAFHAPARAAGTLPLLYFVAVGLGYILVEITFIQRFVLFLGHPTYALTVVVFLLLLSSGLGSLASRKWLTQTKHVWFPLILIAAIVLLYVLVLPGVLNALVGLPFFVKLVVSAVVLVPLGFAMGMPFPTGLRAIANISDVELPASDLG